MFQENLRWKGVRSLFRTGEGVCGDVGRKQYRERGRSPLLRTYLLRMLDSMQGKGGALYMLYASYTWIGLQVGIGAEQSRACALTIPPFSSHLRERKIEIERSWLHQQPFEGFDELLPVPLTDYTYIPPRSLTTPYFYSHLHLHLFGIGHRPSYPISHGPTD